MRLRLQLTLALGTIGLLTSLAVAFWTRISFVAEEHNRFNARVDALTKEAVQAIHAAHLKDQESLVRVCRTEPWIERALWAAKARAQLADRSLQEPEFISLERKVLQARAMVADSSSSLSTLLGVDAVWVFDARDGVVLSAPKDFHFKIGEQDLHQVQIAQQLQLQPELPVTTVQYNHADSMISSCRRSDGTNAILIAAYRILNANFFKSIADEKAIQIAPASQVQKQGNMILRPFTIRRFANINVSEEEAPKIELVVILNDVLLKSAIARIDRVIVFATLISIVIAAGVGLMIARRLVSPLATLARQACKVAEGTATPVVLRGDDELNELSTAFNTMLEDLETTRRRLHAAERVAAWREAARSIAHEIKNPLAPIRASMETLRRLKERNDPAFETHFDEASTIILQEVRRMTSIVDEFSRYARIAPPKPSTLDPVEVARHVVGLFKNQVDVKPTKTTKPRLELVTSPCGQIWADREQLIQVLVNLVKNALEATQSTAEKLAGHVRIDVEPAGHEAVRFVVRDDGPGVSESLRERLFEPYASNKKGGTGLGLAIAQRIAVEHGGAITYSHAPGGGAIFRLIVPKKGPPEIARSSTQNA